MQDEEADVGRPGQVDGDAAAALTEETGEDPQAMDDDIDRFLAVAPGAGV